MNLENLKLIKQLFKYFNQDFDECAKETPLLVQAWLQMFLDCDEKEMTDIVITAMQSFPKAFYPSPLEVYNKYYEPKHDALIDQEWTILTQPRASSVNVLEFRQEITPSMSDEGLLALEAIGGFRLFCGESPSPSPAVKRGYANKWKQNHHNIRNGVITPPPRSLAPARRKENLDPPPMTKEEAKEAWAKLNEMVGTQLKFKNSSKKPMTQKELENKKQEFLNSIGEEL